RSLRVHLIVHDPPAIVPAISRHPPAILPAVSRHLSLVLPPFLHRFPPFLHRLRHRFLPSFLRFSRGFSLLPPLFSLWPLARTSPVWDPGRRGGGSGSNCGKRTRALSTVRLTFSADW